MQPPCGDRVIGIASAVPAAAVRGVAPGTLIEFDGGPPLFIQPREVLGRAWEARGFRSDGRVGKVKWLILDDDKRPGPEAEGVLTLVSVAAST